MDLEPKTVAIIYAIGVLLSFVMTGINSLLGAIKIEVVWTTLPGIIVSLFLLPFLYGTVVHLIDNFLMGENIDFDAKILVPIWIVGVVLSFIMLGVNSLFQLFQISLDWSSVPNILLTLLAFPWLYGTIAHGVDQKLTRS